MQTNTMEINQNLDDDPSKLTQKELNQLLSLKKSLNKWEINSQTKDSLSDFLQKLESHLESYMSRSKNENSKKQISNLFNSIKEKISVLVSSSNSSQPDEVKAEWEILSKSDDLKAEGEPLPQQVVVSSPESEPHLQKKVTKVEKPQQIDKLSLKKSIDDSLIDAFRWAKTFPITDIKYSSQTIESAKKEHINLPQKIDFDKQTQTIIIWDSKYGFKASDDVHITDIAINWNNLVVTWQKAIFTGTKEFPKSKLLDIFPEILQTWKWQIVTSERTLTISKLA